MWSTSATPTPIHAPGPSAAWAWSGGSCLTCRHSTMTAMHGIRWVAKKHGGIDCDHEAVSQISIDVCRRRKLTESWTESWYFGWRRRPAKAVDKLHSTPWFEKPALLITSTCTVSRLWHGASLNHIVQGRVVAPMSLLFAHGENWTSITGPHNANLCNFFNFRHSIIYSVPWRWYLNLSILALSSSAMPLD